jgi:hypothetical protein
LKRGFFPADRLAFTRIIFRRRRRRKERETAGRRRKGKEKEEDKEEEEEEEEEEKATTVLSLVSLLFQASTDFWLFLIKQDSVHHRKLERPP